MKTESKSESIDQYIESFPEPTRECLREMRKAIQGAAPKATEKISYRIPTFHLNGNLVHFAGFKDHIGFYPGPSGIQAFQEELGAYETAKGSIRFPKDKPLPLRLIRKIVRFRVEENSRKDKKKKA